MNDARLSHIPKPTGGKRRNSLFISLQFIDYLQHYTIINSISNYWKYFFNYLYFYESKQKIRTYLL